MTGVVVLAVVLVGATAMGLLWRSRDGRVRPAPEATELLADATLAGLGVDPAAADTTLVQFSSAFCAPCRATRAILARVAADTPGVAHVEVDAESHLDEVRALDIRRTPTVLIVDRSGRVVTRAVGQPRLADVRAAVARDRAAD
ncbi:MAG TPA: thioredoxin family protein [Mycobacteriales bacterium]